MLRGSGQPAPPACRSRLSSAGCAVCPSRRSHTQAAPSVPHSAAHTQPPLWAWPAERPTRAGGSVPRGGAHSATADGLLHRRARPRVVVGCGTRSSPILRAHGGASEAPAASGARAAATRPLDSGLPPDGEPSAHLGAPSATRAAGARGSKKRSRVPSFPSGRAPPPGHLPSLLQVSEGLARCSYDTCLRGCAPLLRPRRTTWRGTPSRP